MNSALAESCVVCGNSNDLSRCSRCHKVYYCNKEHQRADWKRHKSECQKIFKSQSTPDSSDCIPLDYSLKGSSSAITYEGSSENEILSACTQNLTSDFESRNTLETTDARKPVHLEAGDMTAYVSEQLPRPAFREYPEVAITGYPHMPPYLHNSNSFAGESTDPYYEICLNVISDMNRYGLCVLDNFLGRDKGHLVLSEVLQMYKAGIFKDGQLVSSSGVKETRTIRGDQITWIDGSEQHCTHIGKLIHEVDNIIMRANKMPNNGKMGDYNIKGRTKAMVACYPGSGSHYVKHIDNPNKDGRCITAIYYLNLDWDVNTSGGLLRIFPEGWDHVANIIPQFDRILFFWSDRRNPHEVQPAFHTRYAITLWYFDVAEREEATKRYRTNNPIASTSK